MSLHLPLCGQYTYQILDDAEFEPYFRDNRDAVFSHTFDFNTIESLSIEERLRQKKLRSHLDDLFRLNIGVFHKESFVGWTWGWQQTAEKFYMVNTGILKEHRGRGIYTALLPKILELTKTEGFQIVYGRHNMTNNAVIIPKLRAGFQITGFEVSDSYGSLVYLSYYFNPTRRKALDFRVGQSHPDAELMSLFNLD